MWNRLAKQRKALRSLAKLDTTKQNMHNAGVAWLPAKYRYLLTDAPS